MNTQKTRLQTSLQTRAEKQLKEVLSDAARQQRIDLLTVKQDFVRIQSVESKWFMWK